MASPARLCLRILKTLAHYLWALLLFLFVLATLALVHHFWGDLVVAGIFIQDTTLKGLNLLKTF